MKTIDYFSILQQDRYTTYLNECFSILILQKLMQINNAEKDLAEAEEREKEIGVSDDEMTER